MSTKNYKKRALSLNDYKYPENSTHNGKKLKLPPLLSYKLPADLMNELGIPQLTLEELKQKLKHNSKKTPNEPAADTDKDIIVSVKTNEYMLTIKKISDKAETLKSKAIAEYQSKNYKLSLVIFLNSFLLFVIALRLSEIERNDEIDSKLNGKLKESEIKSCTSIINRKQKDWIAVLEFGYKIINNFGKILDVEKEKNIKLYNLLSHLSGMIYYTNGLIELYLSELNLQQLNLMKNNLKETEYKKLIETLDRYEQYMKKSKDSFVNGEKRLGLFILKKGYKNLLTQSIEKLSKLNRDELVLSQGLRFLDSKENKFKIGVNYCLPICSHTWNLDNIINFGGFFIKLFCEQQMIDENKIFG